MALGVWFGKKRGRKRIYFTKGGNSRLLLSFMLIEYWQIVAKI